MNRRLEGRRVGRGRLGELRGVVEIARRHPVEEGEELPGHHLVRPGYAPTAGHVRIGRPALAPNRGRQWNAEEVVEIDLDSIRAAEGVPISEVELSAGMLLGCPLQVVLLPRGKQLHRTLQIRPLFDQDSPVRRSDVVEVEVHRESRRLLVEQVEGGAPLQDQAGPEEGVLPHEPEHPLQP